MSDADRLKWDGIWERKGHPADGADPFVQFQAHRFAAGGRALDLAGGTGRHARWLAAQGLDTTLADLSTVGLRLAAEAAGDAGLPLRTLQVDLEAEGPPEGPWDVVVVVAYLNRTVLGRIAEVLAPGGLLVVVHPTVRNLERNPRPSARFLLDEGEIEGLLKGLEIVSSEEGWARGRHEARVVARLPVA